MNAKAGAVVITGALLAQGILPACSTHDAVCEALAEPSHTHEDLPAGTFRVTSAATVSNVSVGISYINLAADMVSPELT